jgi:hypothetical protein
MRRGVRKTLLKKASKNRVFEAFYVVSYVHAAAVIWMDTKEKGGTRFFVVEGTRARFT